LLQTAPLLQSDRVSLSDWRFYIFACSNAPKRPMKPRYCGGIGLRSLASASTGDRPLDGL
jgi:hypothetical protein